MDVLVHQATGALVSSECDLTSPKALGSTRCSLREKLVPGSCFDFSLEKVAGMFCRTSKFFLVDFADSFFVVKACLPRMCEPRFLIEYSDCPCIENGISYAAEVIVKHSEGNFEIKVVKDRAYDPAGVTGSATNNESFTAIQCYFAFIFLALELHAAYSGVDEESLDSILDVFREYVYSNIQKPLLFEWIHSQVKFACFYKRKPLSYPEFLLEKIQLNELDLGMTRIHTKEYLENYLLSRDSGKRIELPDQYYETVNSVRPGELLTRSRKFMDPLKLAKKGVMRTLPKYAFAAMERVERGDNVQTGLMTALRLELEYKASSHDTSCCIM